MKKAYSIEEIKAILSKSTNEAADAISSDFEATGDALTVLVKVDTDDGIKELYAEAPQTTEADTPEFYAEWEAAIPDLIDSLREQAAKIQ